MTSWLFFEDLQIGQTFESGEHAMERDRALAFAQEFDPQPQHLDAAAAKSSLFGTLVASGWHTASLTMRMQLEALLGRFPGGAMGAQIDRLMWRKPVLPGDRLRACVEVLEMRPSRSRPDRGIIGMHTTTRNQDGDIVLEMNASVLVPRRPAPPSSP